MKRIDLAFGYEKLRARVSQSHKGTHGILTVVSGCRFYRGAPTLASNAALRAGVGIVRVASIECVCQAVAAHLPEAIFLPLNEEENTIAPDSAPILAAKSSAYLVGCGLPQCAKTLALTEQLLHLAKAPLILDAGALTSMADTEGFCFLDQAHATPILTPHLGEMGKLCHADPADVEAHMEQYAVKFAKAHRCIVVLKSHRTVVAMPDGEVYESRLGNAGLAKGGSGDVLAGMIASFAAQGYTPADAALLGVWLHGMSAQLLSKRDTMTAMLPRDLPAMAIQVLHSIPKQGI